MNDTGLASEPLDSPRSQVSLSFAKPDLGQHLTLEEAPRYRVLVVADALGPDIVGVELALDAGRPRRLSNRELTLTLGELLSEDAELTPGAHWLFAAPVAVSGLVPVVAAGGARAAKARRFFVGNSASDAAAGSGAVWLRKPEGSYNGGNGQAVTFDAFAFSALGAPIDAPCTITLRSPKVNGRLRLASPFALHALPSGLYEVSVSAPAAPTSISYFTVNRELGEGP